MRTTGTERFDAWAPRIVRLTISVICLSLLVWVVTQPQASDAIALTLLTGAITPWSLKLDSVIRGTQRGVGGSEHDSDATPSPPPSSSRRRS